MSSRKNKHDNLRSKMSARDIERAFFAKGKDTVINRHGAGVPDRVFLFELWQDRQSELKYRKIKQGNARDVGASTSRRDLKNEPIDKVDMLINKAELLFLSSGKHVRARNVFRIVRENSYNRDPYYEIKHYKRDRRVRSLRKDSTRTLGNERVKEYCNYHIAPGEIITLLRVVESSRRLNVLRHDDVGRKEWLLHLCRRAWETSGHKVIGISTSPSGIYQLRKKAGIETRPWQKLESALRSESLYTQYHAQKNVLDRNETVQDGGKPFQLSSDTVLVIYGADKLMASQLENLIDVVQQQEGKLFLVDSCSRGVRMPEKTPFHNIADHLTNIMPLYLERTHEEVANQLETDIKPALEYPKLDNELGIGR